MASAAMSLRLAPLFMRPRVMEGLQAQCIGVVEEPCDVSGAEGLPATGSTAKIGAMISLATAICVLRCSQVVTTSLGSGKAP